MDENKNHIKHTLSEQLPSHTPDPGTWQRLAAKLDALEAEAAYQQKLQELPVHSPDEGTWALIAGRLNRIAFYKTGIRIAVSVAAGLLLFFTVSKITDDFKTKNTEQFATKEQTSDSALPADKADDFHLQDNKLLQPIVNSRQRQTGFKVAASTVVAGQKFSVGNKTPDNQAGLTISDKTSLKKPSATTTSYPENATAEEGLVTAAEPVVITENIAVLTQNDSIHNVVNPDTETAKTDTETRSILFQKEPYAVFPPASQKYYTPAEPKPMGNKNNFALAMGYFPENMNNGTNTSLFHNVDLTASYNKEKVRFNTSFGMAYNEEHLQFEVNYDINTPVTALGTGGKLDTLSFSNASMESEYLGTEKHKYLTYNLGFGRRLFSTGKFSTWINAGAGFGIKLNEPDLISTTANSIKGQYNARNVSINSSGPVYNDVNVNFVTAIDFNYKIISNLSISLAPVSRWYFKPVLSKNNQATDELTLGFRTGLKFDF